MKHNEHKAAFNKGMKEGGASHASEYNDGEQQHGYNPYPAEQEFKGKGSNQKEYEAVRKRLKQHGENREPIYNSKHDLFE